ncbi:Ig-like domain-containing protein [Streptomyces chryseus]|uniref:Ig-like domain-containing protein n=1 Tax=Streptomyces chryseus TaxID=68186 RepID=UPI00110FF1BB|nr:Ig-like domain-containing protein [Streptomyces chryseus]GGX31750.1 hypothetical protein GCM10010353_53510 [Streptomyces chryseus]
MSAERTATRGLTLLTTTALLALGTVTLGPGTAHAADAAPVGIGRAVTDSDRRGLFSVSAWTDATGADIVSVSARIRSGADVVTEVPALTEQSWDKGRFRVPESAMLKLTEDRGAIPALGRYAIDVTAKDSKGNTTTRQDAGVLDFTLTPRFGELKQENNPNRENPRLRLRTTLMGEQPGSGDLVPLDNATVTFFRTYTGDKPEPAASVTAVTDASGAVTSPEIEIRGWANLRAAHTANTATAHGSAAVHAGLSITPYTVKVTARADRARLLPGDAATVTGRVTHGAANTPVEGTDISVGFRYGGGSGPTAPKTVRTDADGRFTATLTGATGLSLSGWSAQPAEFYVSGEATGALAVPVESALRGVRSTLAADHKVTVTGSVAAVYDREARFAEEPVQLQHSKDGRTGWTKVASAKTAYYSGEFSLSAKGSDGGYYRVHHPTTDAYAESFGPAHHLTRTATRVTSVNAGPEPVTKGKTVTVTGVLQEKSGSGWKAYRGKAVDLYFQAKGSTKWSYVTWGRPASNGKITLKTKAVKDGTWTFRHVGDSKHFNSTSGTDYVDVR